MLDHSLCWPTLYQRENSMWSLAGLGTQSPHLLSVLTKGKSQNLISEELFINNKTPTNKEVSWGMWLQGQRMQVYWELHRATSSLFQRHKSRSQEIQWQGEDVGFGQQSLWRYRETSDWTEGGKGFGSIKKHTRHQKSKLKVILVLVRKILGCQRQPVHS